MAIRRFVREAPRVRAVANADLDVVITLREAVQEETIDNVTYTTPNLGLPIDLTGFTNLRCQVRAAHMTGQENVSTFDDDIVARATGSVTIYGLATNGQLRWRIRAARLWKMQQARVQSAVFDIIGVDAGGVVWSLLTAGIFELVWGVTPPFTESSGDPDTMAEDVFDAPIDLDTLA